MFRQPHTERSKAALAGLLLAVLSGCGQPEQPSTPPYELALEMHDVMGLVLDPAADLLWDSAGSIVTVEGEQDLAPTDAAGWERVQQGAAAVIEAANLLLLPGRAVDDGAWREYSIGLATTGQQALTAAKDQDAEALFTAGADLYQVCVACHQQYDSELAPDQPGGAQ